MAAKKRPNSSKPSAKAYYAAYPVKAPKNKIRSLERHLKKFPEDRQAKEALKNAKAGNANICGGKKPTGRGLQIGFMVKKDKPKGYVMEKKYLGRRATEEQQKVMQIQSKFRKVANIQRHLGKAAIKESNQRANQYAEQLKVLNDRIKNEERMKQKSLKNNKAA